MMQTKGARLLGLAVLVLGVAATGGCALTQELNSGAHDVIEGDQPNDVRLVKQASEEIARSNYQGAEVLLDAALEINPTNPDALYAQGAVYERTNRAEQARALYSKLAQMNAPPTLPSEDGAAPLPSLSTLASQRIAALDRATLARAAGGQAFDAAQPANGPRGLLNGDWQSRASVRLATLDELRRVGLITADEFIGRTGGAWYRAESEPNPDPNWVVTQLNLLVSYQSRGLISPADYAAERAGLLDWLAPVRSMPPLPAPPQAALPQAPMAATGAPAQPTAAAVTTPAPTAAKEAAPGVRVHLASYKSEEAASNGWKILKTTLGALLDAHDKAVERVDLGPKKGVVYRLITGPFADNKDAANFCGKLKTRHLYCTILG